MFVGIICTYTLILYVYTVRNTIQNVVSIVTVGSLIYSNCDNYTVIITQVRLSII